MLLSSYACRKHFYSILMAAAVAQLVRTFISYTEGYVLKPRVRQTLVVKTGSDRSNAKRPTSGMSVKGSRRWPLP